MTISYDGPCNLHTDIYQTQSHQCNDVTKQKSLVEFLQWVKNLRLDWFENDYRNMVIHGTAHPDAWQAGLIATLPTGSPHRLTCRACGQGFDRGEDAASHLCGDMIQTEWEITAADIAPVLSTSGTFPFPVNTAASLGPVTVSNYPKCPDCGCECPNDDYLREHDCDVRKEALRRIRQETRDFIGDY